jgi:competence protein ComEA
MDLEGLPGVGPALAGRILAERERIGGFAQVEDLLAVRGIGPATLERLRPLVSAP